MTVIPHQIPASYPAPLASARQSMAEPQAKPVFASLLAGDTRRPVAPTEFAAAQTPKGAVVPPTSAFDALGMFGHMGGVRRADGNDAAAVAPATPSQPDGSDGSDDKTPVRPFVAEAGPAAGAATAPDDGGWPGVLLASPGPQLEGGPLIVQYPPQVVASATRASDPVFVASDDQPLLPAHLVRAPSASPSQRDAAPVSVTVSGEDNALQIVARTGARDDEDRATLQRLIEDVAHDGGLSVDRLQLDGMPMIARPFATGDQHGR